MSAPVDIKAGAVPKRQCRVSKPAPVPAVELTDMEVRIALAFRRFKPDMKETWVETMEEIARNFELKAAAARPASILSLVVGGAR